MRIEPGTLRDVQYISRRLRAADREELAATRSPENYIALSIDAWMADVCRIAFADDGEPVFVYGFHIKGREARIWGFGTDRTPEVARGVTKHCLRYMMPFLLSLDIDRAHCLVHPRNDLSKRWLGFLGFIPEATISDIGPEREELILYSRGRNVGPHSKQGSQGNSPGRGDRARDHE